MAIDGRKIRTVRQNDGISPATGAALALEARGAMLSGLGTELDPEGFKAYTQGYIAHQINGYE